MSVDRKVRANASFYSPDANRVNEKNMANFKNIEKWVLQKKINDKLFDAVEEGDASEVT